MDSAHAFVMLDLEVGATPIRGSFRAGDDVPLRFEGWIELASLIDAATHSSATPALPT